MKDLWHFMKLSLNPDDLTTMREVLDRLQDNTAMELAKLARIPCKALYTLKIVSDDLNEAACEAFSDADAWSKVRELLVSAGLVQLSATQR